MSRTSLFAQLRRAVRIAHYADRTGLPTREAIERVRDAEAKAWSRRMFLGGAGALAAGCAIDAGERSATSGSALTNADVGIVGAGFAGLVCADELARRGIAATLHEANTRVGGRCWSLGGFFPGQVAERGGELIDNLHKTLLGYAKQFKLTLEDYEKAPGEVFYHFDGQSYSEDVVVDEYRALNEAMHDDLHTISWPTADSFTEGDRVLDETNLAQYLDSRGAGAVIRKALDVAYTIEYGVEIAEQSALALLMFIHVDKRSRFMPFGVFSDERYHIVEGNQAIATGIAARLPKPIQFGRRLVRVKKRSDGRIELTFQEGNKTVVAVHDQVVLTLPFSVLRDVELDASLGLPAWKTYAIQNLRYGTNSKLMIGFTSRPWIAAGSSGVAYADLPHLQNTWESNAKLATASRAILTDYAGGVLGASMNPNAVQTEAEAFLADLERIYPGATAAAKRDSKGKILAHLEHWASNPFSKGSYTANHPGYFTTICDNEAKPVDNLHFAGEHTSSFYEWQGFMEGAALSGLRAAAEVLG